jgi:hypothetical protein
MGSEGRNGSDDAELLRMMYQTSGEVAKGHARPRKLLGRDSAELLTFSQQTVHFPGIRKPTKDMDEQQLPPSSSTARMSRHYQRRPAGQPLVPTDKRYFVTMDQKDLYVGRINRTINFEDTAKH